MSKRSGSENRQRSVQIGVRMLPLEASILWDLASRENMSIGAYLLSKALPRPCDGKNTNVCVAEGCFADACIKLLLKEAK